MKLRSNCPEFLFDAIDLLVKPLDALIEFLRRISCRMRELLHAMPNGKEQPAVRKLSRHVVCQFLAKVLKNAGEKEPAFDFVACHSPAPALARNAAANPPRVATRTGHAISLSNGISFSRSSRNCDGLAFP